MFLKSEKISLRAIESFDVELIYNWENEMKFWSVSNTILPFSRKNIEDYVNSIHDLYSDKQLRLVIELNETKKAIGLIDLYDFDPFHSRAGVGILLADSQFRKQGLATEALNLLINYSFNTLLIHQLHCLINTENEDSFQLFSKRGFQVVGILKDWTLSKEGYENAYLMQLINYDLIL